jgi:hypothetical protein
MRNVVLLTALVLACVGAPQALAAPPVLLSAGVTNLHSTATWSLPPGVQAQIVEVASTASVDTDGYFHDYALEAGGLLSPSQTTWTDPFQLEGGRTYYLHVGGKDTSCGTCPTIEFSNVISFIASGTGGSGGGGGGGTTPTKVGLTVQKAGSGSGTITSFPTGIDCGGACTQLYARNGHVTLTPTPAAGSVFTGWDGGGCSGYGPTCEVAMNVAQTVVATFDLIQPPSLPTLVVARDGTTATATVTVCDDSPGPLTIALIQIWQDRGQWKSTTTTTTQNHAARCETHTVSGALGARSVPALWIAVQVTDVDGRQSSLRTAAAP